MSTKIAPALRELFRETPHDAHFWEYAPARREVLALFAVARAAHRLLRHGNYRMPYPMWSALVDADARLERLSGKGKP